MKNSPAVFLTSQESSQLDRLKEDPTIIGHAMVSLDGEELESSGIWESAVPVFENIFDIAAQVGPEIGETGPCSLVSVESPAFEVIGVSMSSARAVFLRRKGRAPEKVLSSVR